MGSIALLAVTEGLQALPYVLAGIQAIHGEEVAGADKKQLALDALGLAKATADATLPPDQRALADGAAAFASSLIDTLVGFFKESELFGFHKKAKPPAAPPAAPAAA